MSCTVDMDKNELSFCVNGEEQGVAYRGVLKGKCLYPAVSLYHAQDQCRMVFVGCNGDEDDAAPIIDRGTIRAVVHQLPHGRCSRHILADEKHVARQPALECGVPLGEWQFRGIPSNGLPEDPLAYETSSTIDGASLSLLLHTLPAPPNNRTQKMIKDLKLKC